MVKIVQTKMMSTGKVSLNERLKPLGSRQIDSIDASNNGRFGVLSSRLFLLDDEKQRQPD